MTKTPTSSLNFTYSLTKCISKVRALMHTIVGLVRRFWEKSYIFRAKHKARLMFSLVWWTMLTGRWHLITETQCVPFILSLIWEFSNKMKINILAKKYSLWTFTWWNIFHYAYCLIACSCVLCAFYSVLVYCRMQHLTG